MSHELRTPLNAIIGFASVMDQEAFGPINNEKYAQYMRDILQSGQFLLAMINDMLEISRIEANTIEPKPQTTDIAPLVRDCFRILDLRAKEKSVSFASEISDNEALAQVDQRHLKQVVLNLLTNAVKYTHEGDTVLVSVATASDMIELTVEDHGPGIAENQLNHYRLMPVELSAGV